MDSRSVRGDKVRVYRRANSSLWWCSTYLEGERRVSTKPTVCLWPKSLPRTRILSFAAKTVSASWRPIRLVPNAT